MSDIKQAIREIHGLIERRTGDGVDVKGMAGTSLIDMMRPWLVITGLDFKDVVHLTVEDLWTALGRIHDKLGGIIDVLDGDQLREAACRVIGSVTVHSDEPVAEDGVVIHSGLTVSWDGGAWQYVTDPKMRLRESAGTYAEALAAVRRMLGE